jgi:iron complex transport system permease protein
VIALVPAGLTTLLAAALAVAGFSGGWIVTAAACLCVLALAVGWSDLLHLPDRAGSALLVGGLGAAGVVAGMLAVSRSTGPSRPLAVFTGVIAAALLSSFAHELVRRDRKNVVESVTGTVTGQVIGVLAAGWVLLSYTAPGPGGIVVAATAVSVSRLVAALPLPGPAELTPWIGVAFGLIGAVVASFFVTGVVVVTAIVIGAAVAGVGVAIDRTFGPVRGRIQLSMLARAAAPVAAAGTVAYAVVRLGVG